MNTTVNGIESTEPKLEKFDEQSFFKNLLQTVRAWQVQSARIDANIRQLKDEQLVKYHDARHGLF